MKKQVPKTSAAPLAVGTGLVALDVVVSDRHTKAPRYWAGGTCGNVLTVLSYLGWQAKPIARLRSGEAAKQLIADLRRWGMNTEFVSLDEEGSTPVIVQWIRQTPGGEPRHSFSWRCPNCGARLPGYKPVLATDAAALVGQFNSPQVFFFDRLSRGALMLARQCANLGAAVVFEPSSVGNPVLFREAWNLADVVKYSHERLQDLPADLEAAGGPRLQVETHGREGLRYRHTRPGSQNQKWQFLAAIPTTRVQDTAGAGDWCTAGIVYKLFSGGGRALETADSAEVRAAIRYGQALASWTCGFEGARGGMYEVEKPQFQQDVAILLGESAGGFGGGFRPKSGIAKELSCLCPSCEQPDRVVEVHELAAALGTDHGPVRRAN